MEAGPPGQGPTRSGNHLFLVYREPEEWLGVIRRFILDGVDAGERVIWVDGGVLEGKLEEIVRKRGVDVAQLLEEGRLQLRSARRWFFPEGPLDRFRALSRLRAEIERAWEEGFSGLRLIHEMGEVAVRPPEIRSLVAYEAGLNVVLSQDPSCSILCLYDLQRARPELVLAGLELHRLEIQPRGEAHESRFYDERLEVAVPEAEVLPEEATTFPQEAHEALREQRTYDLASRLFRSVRRAAERASSENELLSEVTRELCGELEAPAAHVWLLDPEGSSLTSTGVWHVEDRERFRHLIDATRGIRLGMGEDVPGRAWRSNLPTWVVDEQGAPDFLRGRPGSSLGTGAVAAVPLTGREFQGVIEIFFADARPAPEDFQDALESVGWAAGERLGRMRAEAARERPAPVPEQPRDADLARAAEEEVQVLKSAVQSVSEAVVITTGSFRGGGPSILFANPAFLSMTGHTELEILGRSFRILTGPETDPQVFDRIRAGLTRGTAVSEEMAAYRKDGSQFIMRWDIFPMRDVEGEVRNFLSILKDVTERRRVEEALRQAERDPLTGLPNRNVFLKRLSRVVERSERRRDFRFAVLFVDLDGFKDVNDRLGHVIGDELLISVARRLESVVRPGDTVGRFGGDEFVVLLDHVEDFEDVISVANRIERRLSRPFHIRGEEISTGASIGVAFSESGYGDVDSVIHDADSAMYRAKREGGRAYRVADEELLDEILVSSELKRDLRGALEERSFVLHYQPVIDVASDTPVGFEALIRWEHPERGLLLPGEFIHLAEEMDLIVPIGRWVVHTACHQLREWQERFHPQPPPAISVNLSAREMMAPGFVQSVQSVLEETGVEPRLLHLEIPESALVGGPPVVRDVLDALGEMGLRICIDDFGKGYSTLASLPRYPVQVLKLDQLFVRGLVERAPGGDPVVRSILALARNLGMTVVAEGVETAAEREELRRLSCRYAQGFLFSAAVTVAETEDLLREWAPPPTEGGGRSDAPRAGNAGE